MAGRTFQFEEKGSRILREWNAQRQIQRAVATQSRQAHLGRRSFAAASIDRLTASMQQWSGSVNSDLDAGIAVLRARARALCANSEFGRRFLSLCATNIVGPCGPTLQVRATLSDGKTLDKVANDAIEVAWANWCQSADLCGRMPLSRILQVLVKGVARDGEGLVRLVRDPSVYGGLALQLLEADRLDEAINQPIANGVIRQGVELDAVGRPVAYHLFSAHPGENYIGTPKLQRVPAAGMLHAFLQERAEQVRGYTWLHAVLLRAQMLHGYEEAAVVAARVGASKMGIWTRSEDANGDPLQQAADAVDVSGNLLMDAAPGEFFEAPVGYKLDSWNPDYPHQNYESFIKACVRGLASGLDIATHNLSGDMTEVNYSSARIAELAERDAWAILQEWFVAAVMRPIFKAWLETALMRGDIRLPSGVALPDRALTKFFTAARFQCRTWNWVDPLKDANATKVLLDMGLTSRTSVAAAQGREFEDIVNELAQEKALMEQAGIEPEDKPEPMAPDAEDPEDPADAVAPNQPEEPSND